jgi:hypothetical protein
MSEDQLLVNALMCAVGFIYGCFLRKKELEGPEKW